MKIQIMSDLHLECEDLHPQETNAKLIVLAGDIGKGIAGLAWARCKFPHQQIIYVPGNHEFYGKQRLDTLARMRIEARDLGIHLLDNDEVMIDGVRFLGSTMWTSFQLFGMERMKECMSEALVGLNDFRVIHEGSKGHFSPSHSVQLHIESVVWLAEKLKTKVDGGTVVVTHHLPSMRSVSERYKKEVLAACFASEVDHLVPQADLWIHGHTHDSFNYTLDGTPVICNPKGYGQENRKFDSGLTIDFKPKNRVELTEDS